MDISGSQHIPRPPIQFPHRIEPQIRISQPCYFFTDDLRTILPETATMQNLNCSVTIKIGLGIDDDLDTIHLKSTLRQLLSRTLQLNEWS